MKKIIRDDYYLILKLKKQKVFILMRQKCLMAFPSICLN